MKINGIIAEYNPFHNGHKYHLDASKRLTGADYTIAVMSGNFMQRGMPALTDKHTRASMALENGIDLVLELPAIHATASAEYFASGAVTLLNRLGVVTHLCFGSECGDIVTLKKIAEVLQNEPEGFSDTLKKNLRAGHTYPTARTEALIQYLPEISGHMEYLSSPNNVLGIEYIKAILRQKSSMEPVTVTRAGAGYHDTSINARFCSALAVRQAILSGKPVSNLASYLPKITSEILSERLAKMRPLGTDDFSSILYYKLLSEKEEGYDKYFDVSSDLSDRIKKKLNDYKGFSAFCDQLKTKELTHARISRSLLHIVLNITKDDIAASKENGLAPYARVLGFRKSAEELLTVIKKNSDIPLITKPADAEKALDEKAYAMFSQDVQISQLYLGLAAELTGCKPANELSIPVVINS